MKFEITKYKTSYRSKTVATKPCCVYRDLKSEIYMRPGIWLFRPPA